METPLSGDTGVFLLKRCCVDRIRIGTEARLICNFSRSINLSTNSSVHEQRKVGFLVSALCRDKSSRSRLADHLRRPDGESRACSLRIPKPDPDAPEKTSHPLREKA